MKNQKRIFRATITLEGNTYTDLHLAAQHTARQLEMGTPSENLTWEDGSHVDYDVYEIDMADSYASSSCDEDD